MEMHRKTAIITGGSSGIGKACAATFLAAGYQVVISGRNAENLEKTAAQLDPSGQNIAFLAGDVSKEEDCQALIRYTVEKSGRIDLLVNNAGMSMRALFADTDLKVLKTLMDINFWGTVYCTKYALPYLLETCGSVIGVSSVAGKKGLPARTGYSASKFAMEGFLESLRIENLYNGLHVCICCPGFTASNIRNTALAGDGSAQGESPLNEGKLMSSEEVAAHILAGVRKRKRSIILTRQGKLTVFLNKWLPGWLDKKVYDVMAAEENSPLKKR